MDKQRRLEQPIITGPAACISALDKDLRRFKTNKKLPQRLSLYVGSSQEFQALWYGKLLEAWPESDVPREVTPENVSKLVLSILQEVHEHFVNVADLEGFLLYYDLPVYRPWLERSSRGEASTVAESAMELSSNKPVDLMDRIGAPELFWLNTLPVSKDGVTNGCCFTVYVEVGTYDLLPFDILSLICESNIALIKGDEPRARTLLGNINSEEYQVMEIDNVDVLTKKYQIKLRGLEEFGIPNGELAKLVDGKCLMIKVLYLDEHLRCVGDIYWNGKCLQDELLTGESAARYDHSTPGVIISKE